MHEREVDEVVTAHTVAYTDERAIHFASEVIDHQKEVARMVKP